MGSGERRTDWKEDERQPSGPASRGSNRWRDTNAGGAAAMSRNPAIGPSEQLSATWQSGQEAERPSPPKELGEMEHGLGAADQTLISGENVHLGPSFLWGEGQCFPGAAALERDEEKAPLVESGA
jgi:hypothetical protein